MKMSGYHLKLFLVGKESLVSRETVATVRKALDLALKDNYELEVIDILENPELAVKENVLATPTLLRSAVSNTKRIIGDMKDPHAVRIGLEIIVKEGEV